MTRARILAIAAALLLACCAPLNPVLAGISQPGTSAGADINSTHTWTAPQYFPTATTTDQSNQAATDLFVWNVVNTLAVSPDSVAQATYAIPSSDQVVFTTSGVCASTCTWTLPAAAAYRKGAQLIVYDQAGALSSTATLALGAHAGDTLQGGTLTLNTAYTSLVLDSDGTSTWTREIRDASEVPTKPTGVQWLTSGTTFTTPAGTTTSTFYSFQFCGAGGSGGGANASGVNASAGGSGAGCEVDVSGLAAGTALTYALGAGQTGGANTGGNGTDGTDTTITILGTLYTAHGGKAGTGLTVGTAANGGNGGLSTGSNCDSGHSATFVAGQEGGGVGTAGTVPGAAGGNAPFGFGLGGGALGLSTNGNAAHGYCAGGGGGRGLSSAGGASTGGVIRVQWVTP